MERISSAPSGAGVGGGAGGMGGSSLDIPIHDDNDRYELIGELGTGNFSVARLMRDKITKEPVAIKYIQRGEKVLNFFLYCLKSPILFFFFSFNSPFFLKST